MIVHARPLTHRLDAKLLLGNPVAIETSTVKKSFHFVPDWEYLRADATKGNKRYQAMRRLSAHQMRVTSGDRFSSSSSSLWPGSGELIEANLLQMVLDINTILGGGKAKTKHQPRASSLLKNILPFFWSGAVLGRVVSCSTRDGLAPARNTDDCRRWRQCASVQK